MQTHTNTNAFKPNFMRRGGSRNRLLLHALTLMCGILSVLLCFEPASKGLLQHCIWAPPDQFACCDVQPTLVEARQAEVKLAGSAAGLCKPNLCRVRAVDEKPQMYGRWVHNFLEHTKHRKKRRKNSTVKSCVAHPARAVKCCDRPTPTNAND